MKGPSCGLGVTTLAKSTKPTLEAAYMGNPREYSIKNEESKARCRHRSLHTIVRPQEQPAAIPFALPEPQTKMTLPQCGSALAVRPAVQSLDLLAGW
jgi:hypothetical protein